MAKYNTQSTCQFPKPNDYEQGGQLMVTNFVYEPKTFNYDDFQIEDSFIFFLVLSGSCDFTTDYNCYHVNKGDCFFVFPRKRFMWANINKLKLMYISFINAEAQALLKSMNITYVNPIRHGLNDLIGLFIKEFNRSLALKSPQIIPKSLLLLALSHFLEAEETPRSTSTCASVINDIVHFTNEHFSEKISLQEIAENKFFSYNYISQSFKQINGVSYAKYLQNLRLSHAKQLMITTNKNIAEIAFLCGFSDSHYFEKVFKRIMKQTPTEYRKQYTKIK